MIKETKRSRVGWSSQSIFLIFQNLSVFSSLTNKKIKKISYCKTKQFLLFISLIILQFLLQQTEVK